ncbi:MAG: hypothetical protein IH613_01475 [Desulfuromonadales bacterium]|nr:hypothetical protein [Desulfuromonadales bacterium]
MANIGLVDIQEFEAKMQFTLMAIPMREVLSIVQDQLGGKLTSVTLEAWKAGRSRPSKTKLDFFCRAIGVSLTDMYVDFPEYVEILCRARDIPQRNRDIFLKRIEERQSGSLILSVFSRFSPSYTQRLLEKIGGDYILYNYSINNVDIVNMTLVRIEDECHPFLRVTVKSFRDNKFLSYKGFIFPVRSNLHFVLETQCETHDEVVMIVTNNPVDMGRDVEFLYGIILSGSEDFVSHPSAARVFMEKMPRNATQEEILKKIMETSQEEIPAYYKELICNNTDREETDFVLRAEQLNWAFVERLRNNEQ